MQTEILKALRAHSIACWKVGAGGFRVGERYVRMGQKGMADIIGVVSLCIRCERTELHWQHEKWGRFLAIECKAPGEGPTLEQRAFLESVRTSGGIAFVAHSVDEVAEALKWT